MEFQFLGGNQHRGLINPKLFIIEPRLALSRKVQEWNSLGTSYPPGGVEVFE
jgi:hypothetical protein